MVLQKIRSFKQRMENMFFPDTEFSKRIKFRYATYWKDGFGHDLPAWPKAGVEEVISKIRQNQNWQRMLENKHNSREFAKYYGSRVPDLYWQGRDVSTLAFDKLPENYVLRPTIGYSSKSVFLMKGDLNLLDNRTYTKEEIKAQLLSVAALYPDVAYLCEEFLTDEHGEQRIPDDYKFFMLNGEVASIQLINRFGPKEDGMRGAVACYDEKWNQMRHISKSSFLEGAYQPPPICFDEMLSFAKTLSKAYQTFVRIDFYATQKGAVFGEFCPTPLRGNGFTPFGSKILIKLWDKNCKGMI